MTNQGVGGQVFVVDVMYTLTVLEGTIVSKENSHFRIRVDEELIHIWFKDELVFDSAKEAEICFVMEM